MISGEQLVDALAAAGVSHVVWIPDSHLGTWEPALRDSPRIELVRVCREGEAIGVAAGLLLGGKQPIVLMQCTGFFEAGDALRNVVHDMKLPLFVVVGVRSWLAHQQKPTSDSCPTFTEPIVKAWQIPYTWLGEKSTAEELASAYQAARAEKRAGIALLAE